LDVFEAFRKRKSSRSYAGTPVPDEVLVNIMEAARLAPSAGNVQPWHFIIVRDEEKRRRIAKGCRYGKFLSESPVVIIACGNKKASPRWYAVDTSIAVEHIVLAATARGLGTCWIGMFSEEEIREMVDLPDQYDVVALLSLGYEKKKRDLWARILHAVRPRKKRGEIVSQETYGKKPMWGK